MSRYAGVVLHAALLGPVDTAAGYLGDPHAPGSVESAARCHERQRHRVRGTGTNVDVHWNLTNMSRFFGLFIQGPPV